MEEEDISGPTEGEHGQPTGRGVQAPHGLDVWRGMSTSGKNGLVALGVCPWWHPTPQGSPEKYRHTKTTWHNAHTAQCTCHPHMPQLFGFNLEPVHMKNPTHPSLVEPGGKWVRFLGLLPYPGSC